MSPHTALPRDALNALLSMIGIGGGWIEIQCHRPGKPGVSFWIDMAAPDWRARIHRLVEQQDMRHSAEVTLTLPRPKREWGTAGPVSVLWCRIEGREQLKRARWFKPLPTLVLQEGASSRRLLLWALDRQLQWSYVIQANKRIAYRIGAKQNVSDPDELRINAPGSCLRLGRKRPSPVVVGRLTDDIYAPAQVVGKLRPDRRPLKDPPTVNWWELPRRTTG